MKDPYVYDGTNVLINKREIKSNDQLDNFENAMASLALININRNFIFKDLNDIYSIHKALFYEVYSWAGEVRKINIYKEEPILNGLSVNYSNYRTIKKEIEHLNKEFKAIVWKELNKTEKISKVIFFFASLWKIHPFREGNTRAVSALMFMCLNSIGLKVNEAFVKENAKYFRNALVLSSIDEYSEFEYIEKFLTDAVSIRNSDRNKYKAIKDYPLEEYKYSYHSYKPN